MGKGHGTHHGGDNVQYFYLLTCIILYISCLFVFIYNDLQLLLFGMSLLSSVVLFHDMLWFFSCTLVNIISYTQLISNYTFPEVISYLKHISWKSTVIFLFSLRCLFSMCLNHRRKIKNKQKTPLDNSQSFYADSFKASHRVLCDVSKRVIAWSV